MVRALNLDVGPTSHGCVPEKNENSKPTPRNARAFVVAVGSG